MSSATVERSLASPRSNAMMRSIVCCTSGGGAVSPAAGNRWSMRARVSASPASGSCTPATPHSPQAMPHRPIAVSKSAKPLAVMTRSYHPLGFHHLENLALEGLWSTACRRAEDALELDELGGGGIGGDPEAQIAFIPVAQAIAVAAQRGGEIAAGRGQHKDIDDMLAAPVDECGNRLAGNHVEPTANQRKTLAGEVDGGRRQVALSGEPRLDRVLVGGSDIGQMAGEQRAQMAVDQLAGDGVFLPLSGDQQGTARADGDGYEDRGGIGEPAGCGPRRRRARCRLGAERGADVRAQRFRRAIDRGREADAVAQPGEGG